MKMRCLLKMPHTEIEMFSNIVLLEVITPTGRCTLIALIIYAYLYCILHLDLV